MARIRPWLNLIQSCFLTPSHTSISLPPRAVQHRHQSTFSNQDGNLERNLSFPDVHH